MLIDLNIPERYDGFLFLAEAARNPPSLAPHRHVELELNLITAGEVSYVINGRRSSFHAGTLLWLFPQQVHQLVSRTSDACYYVAVFKPDLIAQISNDSVYASLAHELPPQSDILQSRLSPVAISMLKTPMDRVSADGLDPDLLNKEAGYGLSPGFRFEHRDPVLLNAALRYLLVQAWRLQLEGAHQQKLAMLHPSVRKALALLESEDCPASLSQLAQSCSISSAHLSRLFGREMGMPLSAYRNAVRLRRFWEHYERLGSGMMMQAMFQAGFGSYAQFYRVFKEHYGCGPRASLEK